MTKFWKRFRSDENGAVTVDWVVLTAAIVGMAAVAYDAVSSSALALGDGAADAIATQNDGFGASQ